MCVGFIFLGVTQFGMCLRKVFGSGVEGRQREAGGRRRPSAARVQTRRGDMMSSPSLYFQASHDSRIISLISLSNTFTDNSGIRIAILKVRHKHVSLFGIIAHSDCGFILSHYTENSVGIIPLKLQNFMMGYFSPFFFILNMIKQELGEIKSFPHGPSD